MDRDALDVKTYGEPIIRMVLFNLEVDGGLEQPGSEPGRLPERWSTAHHQLLVPLRPHVLMRQEVAPDRLKSAAEVLGMRGFPGPQRDENVVTGLFFREDTFGLIKPYALRHRWRIPPACAQVSMDDAPERRLLLTSWHTAFNSPFARRDEADELSALADKVSRGIAFAGGGDCNESPLQGGESLPAIDWSSPEITDPVHKVHRTIVLPDGTRVSSTGVDQLLRDCRLHDAARHAAHARQQSRALDATAGHAAVGQGGLSRPDRLYLDGWLIQAVLAVNVVDTSGLSDHHLLEVILSRRVMVQALRRLFPPFALAA